jgi:hypothetical protein
MSNNQQLMNILKNCHENNSLRKANTNLYILVGFSLIAFIYIVPKIISVMKENRVKENLYKTALSKSNYLERLTESQSTELAQTKNVLRQLEKQLAQYRNNTISQSSKTSGTPSEG